MAEFGRAEIRDALDELSEALARDRRRAHIHMVLAGGRPDPEAG